MVPLKMEDGNLNGNFFLRTLPSVSSLDSTAHDFNHSLPSNLNYSTIFHPMTLAKNNHKPILPFTFSAFTSQMVNGKKKKAYNSMDGSHYKFLVSNLNWALSVPRSFDILYNSFSTQRKKHKPSVLAVLNSPPSSSTRC